MVPPPKLSIVIPTAGGRRELLCMAVQSSLADPLQAGVEVIVARNGGCSELCGVDDARIRYVDVPQRNANVARNVGLGVAAGEYVRFLDDDDVLEPAGVAAQLDWMQSSGIEACTGAVWFVDRHMSHVRKYEPKSPDFVVELLMQRASTLPVAQMFKRSLLDGLQWNPARDYLQDVEWMYSLIRRADIRWMPFSGVVGYWRHHDGPRTSIVYGTRREDEPAREAEAIISASIGALERQGRLSAERRRAAAKALWDYAHSGFRYNPRYWAPIAQRALALDPLSRPPGALMRVWPFSRMDPIKAERLAFPVRTLVARAWVGISRVIAHIAARRGSMRTSKARDASS